MNRVETLAKKCNDRNITHAVEIGVDRAEFAVEFLRQWNGKRLYGIDPYTEYWDAPREGKSGMAWDRNADYLTAIHRLAPFGERSRIVRAAGHVAYDRVWPTDPIGFVYIDGQHTYEACGLDIEIWWPRIVANGILAGHDYCDYHPGVMRAVDEFAKANKLGVRIIEDPTPSWWISKP